MKKIVLLIGLFLMLGCTQAVDTGPKGSIDWVTDLPAAKELALEQGKPILIDFYADWCSWCRRMDSDVYANMQVAEKAKQFICVKIDTQEQPDVAENYKVRGLPTTAFLTSKAEKIDIIPGYLPPEDFLKKMQSVLKAQ
ncbi:MAG: thioredoxin family protein [Candidatus Omnitrophica bacterium]|nr:thioredoxin family protein [Candidatus Omnitrophota bacterium]